MSILDAQVMIYEIEMRGDRDDRVLSFATRVTENMTNPNEGIDEQRSEIVSKLIRQLLDHNVIEAEDVRGTVDLYLSETQHLRP